jgi:hypothetical protein
MNFISASLMVPLLLTMQIMAGGERQQFSRCLRSYVDTKIDARTSNADFDSSFGAACAQQEAAYRAAYIAAARRAGDSQAAAERDVTVEVEDLRTNFKELFHDSQPQ